MPERDAVNVVLGAALVDVGGTLWPELGPPSDQQQRRLQDVAGLDHQQASRLAHALNTAVASWESPTVLEQDTQALIEETLRELDVANSDGRDVREAMCVPASEGAALFPDAAQLLRTVADLGLRTIIVSNTAWRDAEDYRRDFEFFGVSNHIHSIVTSLDVGFRKPHPSMFRAAFEASGCDPSECVVIGDSEEKDIAPAVAHGMRSILVAIERPPPAQSGAQAVATSLQNAGDILRKWTSAHP
ncbi:MAG: HAD family hydrolase [Actinomycetota bacterium]